jgi:DNA-binding transcriptional ArsR family regulator
MEEDVVVDTLKALAHPLRYKIMAALAGGERNVGEIEEATGIAQPGLSQQLAVLRQAGAVRTRRQAKLIYYSVESERLAALASALASLAGTPAEVRASNGKRNSTGVASFARLEA